MIPCLFLRLPLPRLLQPAINAVSWVITGQSQKRFFPWILQELLPVF
jgi:hypothetical protein